MMEYWNIGEIRPLNSFRIHPTLHYSNIPLIRLRIYLRQWNPSISKIFLWDFIENNPDPICRNLKDLDDGFRHFLNQLFLFLRCPSLNHADLDNGHWFLLSVICITIRYVKEVREFQPVCHQAGSDGCNRGSSQFQKRDQKIEDDEHR